MFRKISLVAALVALFSALLTAPAQAADNPVNTVAPKITGNMTTYPYYDATLAFYGVKISDGTWTVASGSITYAYQWYLCTSAVTSNVTTTPAGCTAITAAPFANPTTNAMTIGSLGAGQLGKYLTASVTATNSSDSSTSVIFATNTQALIAAGSRPSITANTVTATSTTTVELAGTMIANNMVNPTGCVRSGDGALTAEVATGAGQALTNGTTAVSTITSSISYTNVVTPTVCTFTSLTPGATYYFQFRSDSYATLPNNSSRYTYSNAMTATTPLNISFSANSGTGSVATTGDLVVGSTFVTPTQGSMLRTNYSFTGWKINNSGSLYPQGSDLTVPGGAGNITLYAQWVSGSTLDYLPNGGTGTQTDSASPYATTATATVAAINGISRNGYNFTGWNTKADGTGTPYVAGAAVPMTTQVRLYAQWAAIPAPAPTASAAPAPIVAPQVTNFSVPSVPSGTPSNITLGGSNFSTVNSVQIGSSVTKFTIVSDEELSIVVPALDPGSYDLIIINSLGKLTFVSAIRVKRVAGTLNPDDSVPTQTIKITGFAPGSARMTNAMKSSLEKILKLQAVTAIQCNGFTQGPTILAKDKALALSRANAVCDFAATVLPRSVATKVAGYRETKTGSSIRRAELVLTK